MQTNIQKFSKTKVALCITLAVLLVVCTLGVVFLSANSPTAFAAGKEMTYTYNLNVYVGEGVQYVDIYSYHVIGGTETLIERKIVYRSSIVDENPVVISKSISSNEYGLGSLKVTWTAVVEDGYIIDGESSGTITGSTINTDISVNAYTQTPLPATPTKTGYTFTGWYTDEDCTNLYTEEYITGNITLYAGWRVNTYAIKFNGNGSTSGSMGDLAMTYNVAKNLTSNAFARTGYKFDGWATSADGDVVYTNEQSVSNLTATDGAVIQLYAHWSLVDYTVQFDGNGNDGGSMSATTHVKDTPKALATNAFTKTGYSLKGWATSADGDVVYTNGQTVTNISAPGTTITLYAVWEANTYTIQFNGNGAEAGEMANLVLTYDEAKTLTANTFTRTGYTFKGWATSADGDVVYTNSKEVLNLTTTANDTLSLYAVWQINRYSVTFMVDGEVWAIVRCDHGTPSAEIVASNVDTTLYETVGELPN